MMSIKSLEQIARIPDLKSAALYRMRVSRAYRSGLMATSEYIEWRRYLARLSAKLS